MADISLTSAMRSNLLQLQMTEKLMDRTQQRISTGKKINSALDGPAAFFAAKSLSDRAGDLATLKESMGQAISTIKAADVAVSSITELVQQAKAIANTAKQNLGTDTVAVTSREASASQFDELMSQINTLVEDAGYAGKNLLLGDGAVYGATSSSVDNVDALTGVSGSSVSNIGGGTSANNVDFEIVGAVDSTVASINTVESAIDVSDLAITSFTATGDITVAVTNESTSSQTQVAVNNSYSTSYQSYADTNLSADTTVLQVDSGAFQVSKATFDLSAKVFTGQVFTVALADEGGTTETSTYTVVAGDTMTDVVSSLTTDIATGSYTTGAVAGVITITATDSTNSTDEFTTAVTATAESYYLVSEGSASTAESDLGISDLSVAGSGVLSANDVSIAITSDGVDTTLAVSQTGSTSVGITQTVDDGDTSASLEFYMIDDDEAALLAVTTTAGASVSNINYLADDVVKIGIETTDDNDYTVTLYKADGSTSSTTATIADGASSALTFSTDSTMSSANGTATVTLTNATDNNEATSAEIFLHINKISLSSAGVDAGASTGTAALDIGTLTMSTVGIGSYSTSGFTSLTESADGDAVLTSFSTGTDAIVLEDNREITITQGSETYTRAVVPGSGEGTLSTGTNTFVLEGGTAVSTTVNLNILTAGTTSLAAYTVTAAGTSNDLEVFFNEDSTSSVTITSVDSSTTGLDVANAANDWYDAADITQAVNQLDAALDSLRTVGQTLTNNLSIVQTREDFTSSFIVTLEEGADKWTLADANEEGANMLMLQTRQQLGTVSLSIASQSAQSILRLFG